MLQDLEPPNLLICCSYGTVPSAIWQMFSEFLIFCNYGKIQQNIRNKGDICHDARACHAITKLLQAQK